MSIEFSEQAGSPIRPFRYFTQKVLPAVYDDSLSYMELVAKTIDYLNEVIEAVNANSEATVEMQNLLTQYKQFMDDYFENLDVQEEVDAKLDEMAANGTLAQLMEPIMQPIIAQLAPTTIRQWLDEHPEATTTVEDGSITNAKLAQSGGVLSEVEDIRTGYDGTVYESAGDSVREQIDFLVKTKENIYAEWNPVTLTELGHYLSKNNTFNQSDGVSQSLAVSEGDIYKVSCYCPNPTWYPGLIFRKNGAIVSYKYDSSLHYFEDEIILIGADVDEIVVNGGTNMYKGVVEAPTKQDLDTTIREINDAIEDAFPVNVGNKENYSLLTGILSKTNVVNPNYGRRMELNITNQKMLYISGYQINTNTPLVIFKDSNDEIISYIIADTNDFHAQFIDIPSGTSKVVVNGSNAANAPYGNIGIWHVNEARPEYYVHFTNTSLINKTAVFFGTSIPAGERQFDGGVYSIPTYAGKMLSMNIINEAVGSSMARKGFTEFVSADDPYGITGLAWDSATRAMGQTIAAKNDIINNWETKWRDLFTGSNKPQTLTDEQKNFILSCSYENKLIPYLNGTKPMPDLFIFEHGHNDYKGTLPNGAMKAIPTDENNLVMTEYSDAMYFYFQKIFEANPQAKILMVSHYDRTTVHGNIIWNTQKALAEYHELWFCDTADALAWSQRLIKTTGYWDATTHLWVPSGGTLQTMTRKAQALYDNLHPASDYSGNAIKAEANVIARFIASNIML